MSTTAFAGIERDINRYEELREIARAERQAEQRERFRRTDIRQDHPLLTKWRKANASPFN